MCCAVFQPVSALDEPSHPNKISKGFKCTICSNFVASNSLEPENISSKKIAVVLQAFKKAGAPVEHTLGSKNTRMAPKTHTTYVRISTQRMDTLHTIRWRGGDSTKNQCGKNSSIQRSSSALAYVFGSTIPRTPFLNRLFCIEIFIFETSNHPLELHTMIITKPYNR